MARGEDGAAILIGEDGEVEGVDPARNGDNLTLVHPDQRTEHRHRSRVVRGGDGLQGLARHLTETLAGDERGAALDLRDAFRDAHHEPANQDGEIILRALVENLLLHAREGNRNHIHPSGVGRDAGKQLGDLLLGALACIGRAGKMDRRELHAALGHHPRGHGAVDAAADENGGLAARADGDPARALLRLAMDVRGKIADLHANRHVRLMDVDRQVRESVEQTRADLGGDLRRIKREFLIGALRLHLERPHAGQLRAQVLNGGGADGLHALLRHAGAREGDHAEDLAHAFHRALKIRALSGRDGDRRLRHAHLELPERREAAADIFNQRVLKRVAVQALEDNLPELEQKYFLHRMFSFSVKIF